MASGNEPDSHDQDRMALSSYARAMDHVGVMSDDPAFRWVERVVLDLHFDACYFQKDKDPGRYRRSGVEVTESRAAARRRISGRHTRRYSHSWARSSVAGSRRRRRLTWPCRAAMAHLHLVSVHPFRDGNGRIARIVQSLVLAREGLLAPEFVSIEEYLGSQHRRLLRDPRTSPGG